MGGGASKSRGQGPRRFQKDYSIQKRLGKGSFAVVCQCHQLATGEPFAVKILRTPSPGDRGHACSEAKLWSRLGKNEHCVQLLHFYEERTMSYLVMEMCATTILDAFLSNGAVSERDLARTFYGMLRGLEHIHACGIVHRDVKSENYLLPEGPFLWKEQTVKLCDFGLSIEVPQPKRPSEGTDCTSLASSAGITGVCGTAMYMAPEMLRGETYAMAVDIWAVGVLAYLMLFGEFPYESNADDVMQRQDDIMDSIREGKREPQYRASPGCPQPSEAACLFVKQLLLRSPHLRLDASKALNSPFVSLAMPAPAKTAESPGAVEHNLGCLHSFQNILLLAHESVEKCKPQKLRAVQRSPEQEEVVRSLRAKQADNTVKQPISLPVAMRAAPEGEPPDLGLSSIPQAPALMLNDQCNNAGAALLDSEMNSEHTEIMKTHIDLEAWLKVHLPKHQEILVKA